MPDRSHSSSAPLSGVARFRRRAYVFAVTALAVFLWGFAVSRAFPERFTATAVIHLSPAATADSKSDEPIPPAIVAATIRRDLINEENLASALRAAGVVDPIGSSINELNSGRLSQLAELRGRLQVTAQIGRTEDDLQINVSYRNQNAARATAIVNQLVADYANRNTGSSQVAAAPAYDRAQQAVESAQQKAATARAELSEFIARQRDKKAPAPPDEKPAETMAPPAVQPDPTLASLSQQMRDLTARRGVLLTRLTPQHPEMQQLEWQISELQKQIDALPTKTELSEAPVPPASIHGEPVASHPWLSAEEADQYARLVKAVDEAQGQLDHALQHQRAAWDEQVRIAPAGAPAVLLAAVPTRPDSSLRELILAGSAVLAVAAGLAMATFASGVRPMFLSVAQAQAALPVPIVGAISTTELHKISARRGLVPLPFRFATFLCELSLALWLVAAISLSLADRQFGVRMLHDPASALSDAITQLLS
jgi:uncharacterized protein involved in exopolysaccharide biosynthesis